MIQYCYIQNIEDESKNSNLENFWTYRALSSWNVRIRLDASCFANSTAQATSVTYVSETVKVFNAIFKKIIKAAST